MNHSAELHYPRTASILEIVQLCLQYPRMLYLQSGLRNTARLMSCINLHAVVALLSSPKQLHDIHDDSAHYGKNFSNVFDNIPDILEYVTHTVEEFAYTFVYFSNCLKDFCNVVQDFLQFLVFE